MSQDNLAKLLRPARFQLWACPGRPGSTVRNGRRVYWTDPLFAMTGGFTGQIWPGSLGLLPLFHPDEPPSHMLTST